MGALRAIALVGLFVALYLLSAVVSYYGMLFYVEWRKYELKYQIGPWDAVPLTNREYLAAAIWRYWGDPLNPPKERGRAYLDGLPALVRSKGYWPWYGPYEWVENESGVYVLFTPTWTGGDLFIESCWGPNCPCTYCKVPGTDYMIRELDSVLVRPYVHLTFSPELGYPNGYLEIGYLIDLRASVKFDGDTERISYPATLKAVFRYNISGWAWRELEEPITFGVPSVKLVGSNKTLILIYKVVPSGLTHDEANELVRAAFMGWCEGIRAVIPDIRCSMKEMDRVTISTHRIRIYKSSPDAQGVLGESDGVHIESESAVDTLAHEMGHLFALGDLYYAKTFEGVIATGNKLFGRSFSYRIGAATIMFGGTTYYPRWVNYINKGVTLADVFTLLREYYIPRKWDWLLPNYTVENDTFGLFACLPVFVGTEGDDGILSAFFGAPIVFFTRDGVHNGTTAQVRLFEYMARYGKEHGMCGSLNDVLKDWREKRVVNWAVWGWDYKQFTTPWGWFRTIMLGVYDSKAPRPRVW